MPHVRGRARQWQPCHVSRQPRRPRHTPAPQYCVWLPRPEYWEWLQGGQYCVAGVWPSTVSAKYYTWP